MLEVYGDFWEYPADVRLITTNGFVKNNGEAVMGRGVALQAKTRYPRFPKNFGTLLKEKGNHVMVITGATAPNHTLGTFPTKHNWFEKSDISLIRQSAEELRDIALRNPSTTYLVVRPGVGNGQLAWIDVKPVIEGILPDNVLVITNAS